MKRLAMVLLLGAVACSPFEEAAPGKDAGAGDAADAGNPAACGDAVLETGFDDLSGVRPQTKGVATLAIAADRFKSPPSALRVESDGPNSHAYLLAEFTMPAGEYCARIAFDVFVEAQPSSTLELARVHRRAATANEEFILAIETDLRVRIIRGARQDVIGVLSTGDFTRIEIMSVSSGGTEGGMTRVGAETTELPASPRSMGGQYELLLGIMPNSGKGRVVIDDLRIDVASR